MSSPISEIFGPSIADAKAKVEDAGVALAQLLLHDSGISHNQRLLLIQLQAGANKQIIALEQIAIAIDSLEKRCDALVRYLDK